MSQPVAARCCIDEKKKNNPAKVQNKQTVYFVSGLPGVGKTSTILPEILKKKPMPFILTDCLRPIVTNILTGEVGEVELINLEGKVTFRQARKEPQTKEFKEIEEKELNVRVDNKEKDEDYFGCIGAIGLIKSYTRAGYDVFVDGIAFDLRKIVGLGKRMPEIKIKAAFIGYSKEWQDSRTGRGWQQKETKRSNDLEKEVKKINLPNYKYFDLIQSLSSEKQNSKPLVLEENDLRENAKKIVDYLLKI